MPDLLIVPLDNKSLFEIEEVAKAEGVRFKSALEISKAVDWLALREFDFLVVDAGIPIGEQQKLAGLLWQKNQTAPFVVYNFDEQAAPRPEVRLFGAETAFGKDALEQLREKFKKFQPRERAKAEKFKILVVEDLDSPRDIVCAYLESLGYPDVVGVASVKEAIEALTKNVGEYSCVLTDIRMPQQSGAELIQFIRQDKRLSSLPVIVLTAYGTADCLIDCLRAGASGFLVKPPKRNDLVRELSRALRISLHGESPRLAKPDEAEILRDLLVDKGYS